LDHFKQVNDKHGHQAGDEVIVNMAKVLKDASRPGDLVARYGGEEFVLLCDDCEITSAARRAERLRRTFGQMDHPKLNGRRVTASFGVTQIQPGDTAETIVRRADRALLMAKDQGRNRVIQLGTGAGHEKPARRWAFWRRTSRRPLSPEVLVEQDLVIHVPIRVVIEKLRGFVADHQATVTKVEEDALELGIEGALYSARRKSDVGVLFAVNMQFMEEQLRREESSAKSSAGVLQIRLHVTISSQKTKDPSPGGMIHRARQIMTSLRAYLMASAEGDLLQERTRRKARRILMPWLSNVE
jgi:diguanylate cyclase (GGDEF)-like protein